jgi:DNA ligase-1
LTDEEIIQVDSFIRKNTLGKFGPVRTVKPELVFELEFDGIQKSSRNKSGIVVLSPRITRWHHYKKIEEASSLNSLIILLNNSST